MSPRMRDRGAWTGSSACCGTIALVVGACALLAVGCSSSSPASSPEITTRRPPELVAPTVPPISQFVERADGSRVAAVSADVLFDLDSAILRADARAVLMMLLPDIREHGGVVRVAGFADGLGETAHNLDLSRRRAAAVAQFLETEAPRPAGSIPSEGRGEEGAADGIAEPARRRVEITLEAR